MTTVVVPVPLIVKPSWILAMACWVASSARPEAVFCRVKFRVAICSTREVERKETAMVVSRAVIRRTRMRALPESEGLEEGLTTEDTEHTEERKRHNELRKNEFILSFISEAGLVGVEGYEAAHGDGALGDEALDIRVS